MRWFKKTKISFIEIAVTSDLEEIQKQWKSYGLRIKSVYSKHAKGWVEFKLDDKWSGSFSIIVKDLEDAIESQMRSMKTEIHRQQGVIVWYMRKCQETQAANVNLHRQNNYLHAILSKSNPKVRVR